MRKKILCLLLLVGCSRLVLQRPPVNVTPQIAAQEWVACTDVPFAPLVDTAIVAAAVSFFAFAATQDDDLALVVGGVFFAPIGIASGVSAVRGAKAVSACKKLHNIYEQSPDTQPTSLP